ncbi:MAG: hypothetical protein IPG07_18830 [Crocinitomicaceae bacterium]|nr:hypothetical protein [Crocinitomicaceae bacterium]
MSKIHIGKKIKEVLDNSPMKAVELAKKISLTRVGLYKIFEKESIATDQLQKISTALKHDFFVYYQSELNLVSDAEPRYGFAAKEDVEELTRIVSELAKTWPNFSKIFLRYRKVKWLRRGRNNTTKKLCLWIAGLKKDCS